MKLTRESLKKSLELQKINLDLGYDQTRMPTEDYIALVQAHIEALDCLKLYQNISIDDADAHYGISAASEFLSKHGGVE